MATPTTTSTSSRSISGTTTTSTKRTPLPFTYQFLAASVAGITEIAFMYPLDLVKTRFQLQVNPPLSKVPLVQPHGINTTTTTTTATTATKGQAPTPPRPYTSILGCLQRVIRREGVLHLYRGMLPPLIAEAPKRAIKFGANEQWGFALKKLFSLDRLTAFQAGFVGSMAGATEAFFITPFELVKVRLQDRGSLKLYTGTADCIRKVASQEGIFTFYHGLEATIWRHATWSGMYFMTIHGFRTAFPELSTASREESMMRNFVAGTLGGAVGTLVNTPFDVVKSRIQNQHEGPIGYTFSRVARLYRQEGFRALYKGLAPKLLRLGPGGGLLLVVFDRTSELLRSFISEDKNNKSAVTPTP
ncbi:hypothetical protein BG015_001675 [Linnemannia schmuckeri]|uniref:Mitochondrial carrier n=1 Tax=Linnemannia schmuckeri TaxID=64567 RepID=A0A9P5RRY0_9FUNG|nr:hypothetical protein BG015_001675 [Linnemannia schmuckeri]